MKQANELNGMIKELLGLPQVDETTKKRLPASVLNGRRKKVKFYNLCWKYLQSNPSEEFCKNEINKLDLRLKLINQEYPAEKIFATLDEEKNFKKEFNNKWDIPKIKEQLKTLRFLLK